MAGTGLDWCDTSGTNHLHLEGVTSINRLDFKRSSSSITVCIWQSEYFYTISMQHAVPPMELRHGDTEGEDIFQNSHSNTDVLSCCI